ncbi:MAG: polyprenyl diphosphate synthase [Deltaproteobacteria bacterium]|nr:polyprenyl diphosphate synthase [Deltaproteobacteria bacterium]
MKVPLVDLRRLPKHVAIIMDGNGRWAELRGLPRTAGHREGSRAVRRIVRAARRLGIQALTLYAFSEQNWARPPEEVAALMELLREFLISERREILDHRIRLRSIGRTEKLPAHVREVLRALEEESSGCDGMTLVLALSYGGREELADCMRLIAQEVLRGVIHPQAIDEALIDCRLPSMAEGAVDLLIRTGGEQRLSNFLLWNSAYAELVFSSKLWPEFEVEDFYSAIAEFQSRERRFGRIFPHQKL